MGPVAAFSGRVETLWPFADVSRARWRGEDAARDTLGPAWREFGGGWVVWWMGQAPSGRRWQGSQPSKGATELCFPGPVFGKMQSEAARLAGEPSGQREEAPPEGLGGNHLLVHGIPINYLYRWLRHSSTWSSSWTRPEAWRRCRDRLELLAAGEAKLMLRLVWAWRFAV